MMDFKEFEQKLKKAFDEVNETFKEGFNEAQEGKKTSTCNGKCAWKKCKNSSSNKKEKFLNDLKDNFMSIDDKFKDFSKKYRLEEKEFGEKLDKLGWIVENIFNEASKKAMEIKNTAVKMVKDKLPKEKEDDEYETITKEYGDPNGPFYMKVSSTRKKEKKEEVKQPKVNTEKYFLFKTNIDLDTKFKVFEYQFFAELIIRRKEILKYLQDIGADISRLENFYQNFQFPLFPNEGTHEDLFIKEAKKLFRILDIQYFINKRDYENKFFVDNGNLYVSKEANFSFVIENALFELTYSENIDGNFKSHIYNVLKLD